LLIHQRRTAEARVAFQQAVKLDPHDEDANRELQQLARERVAP